MRELEFLPDWYPQARRRRRLVHLQGWLTLLLIAGMGTHLLMADRNIAVAEGSVGVLLEPSRNPNAVGVASYQAYDTDLTGAVPAMIVAHGDYLRLQHLVERTSPRCSAG